MAAAGWQQLRVIATFSDGREADVTHHARFQSNNDGVATVLPTGQVIAQDVPGEAAIMVGYMNEEAFRKTVETGFATFYSRSRGKLWLKGETSGHRLVVREIAADCDLDAVLVRVEALGPGVCHEGYQSCFFRKLENGAWQIAEERAYDPKAVYGDNS